MTSIFKWIKECVNFVFGHTTDELLARINQHSKDLSSETKEQLISSVMLNRPDQFVAQMNNVPINVRQDLMASVMRASQLYANPLVHAPTVVSVNGSVEACDIPVEEETNNPTPIPTICEPEGPYDLSGPLEPTYEEQVDNTDDELPDIPTVPELEPEVIYISRIIPSDQFHVPSVNHHFVEIGEPLTPVMDYDRFVAREEQHQKLKAHISQCRSVIKEQDQIIHTGKIIPSDQFVPIPVALPPVRYEEPMPALIDLQKYMAREAEHQQLKDYIRMCRSVVKEQERTIHTGKIIPLDHFVPVGVIRKQRYTLIHPEPSLDPIRAHKRATESRKLRQFIRHRRQELAQNKWVQTFSNVLKNLQVTKNRKSRSNDNYWAYYFKGYNNKPRKNNKILNMERKWNQHY